MVRLIPLPAAVVSLYVASLCPAANLAVSTYFRDGFTPSAVTSDASGNLYIAGTVPLDPESPGATAAVAKLDPMATQYLYLAYLDAAASDSISAIAVDSAGNAYVAGWTTNPNFPSVGSSQLGTPPTSAQDPRSFVVKLDSRLFSRCLSAVRLHRTRWESRLPRKGKSW
jgi:Beta-propeller repeat